MSEIGTLNQTKKLLQSTKFCDTRTERKLRQHIHTRPRVRRDCRDWWEEGDSPIYEMEFHWTPFNYFLYLLIAKKENI